MIKINVDSSNHFPQVTHQETSVDQITSFFLRFQTRANQFSPWTKPHQPTSSQTKKEPKLIQPESNAHKPHKPDLKKYHSGVFFLSGF